VTGGTLEKSPGDVRPSACALALALLVFIPLVYCTMFLDRDTATWLIEEEHPIEALGALSLLVASIACFLLFHNVRGDPRWPRLRRLSLLGFGALFFFGAGEEESWGQRILGIQTPPGIAKANAQHETNIHNLTALGALNTDKLFSFFWLLIGVVVPVLALWRTPRRHLRRFLPILPVAFAGLFVLNQALFNGFLAFFTHNPQLYQSKFPLVFSLVEIKEKMAELLLAAGFVFVLLRWRAQRPPADPTAFPGVA